ncbi:MAG: two-component system nitrate/nitrite response regulator NarL [Gammaproteobacteria bacterium]|jgi:two-component system nitrate/nitrite response regulator NarL
MTKVIIFSDIKIYCEGLTRILSSVEPLQVVGSESHFDDVIDKIERLKPDVILLDMTMTGSCHTAKKILHYVPDVHIVALSAPADEKNVISCAEAGVAGYVAREASLDELIETIKIAGNGEACYPPKAATFIFNRFKHVNLAGNDRSSWRVNDSSDQETSSLISNLSSNLTVELTSTLTFREQQIARLISEGLSNKQISRSLCIEVSTVKNHVHNVLVKLSLDSRTQVVSQFRQSAGYKKSRRLSDLGNRSEEKSL